MRSILVASLIFATGPAVAEGPPHPQVEPPRLVEIEVKDDDHARSASARFVVAVSGVGPSSAVGTFVGDAAYTIKVRRDNASGTYAIDLTRHRVRTGPPAADDLSLELAATGPLEPEKRKVVALVARPDSSRTEVALTLH